MTGPDVVEAVFEPLENKTERAFIGAVPPDTVHVWWISPRSLAWIDFDVWLSMEERQRARRYQFAVDRQRFQVVRGALRLLLGRYLEVTPKRLTFSFGTYGKPSLSGEQVLHFNVSHTADLSAIAISGEPVGVDVERPGRELDLTGIAESHFCGGELDLMNFEPERVEANFYRIWTRKEASLKLLGTGLRLPMDDIDTSREKLWVGRKDGGGKREIRLRTYTFSDGCPISLATAKEARDIRFFRADPNVLVRTTDNLTR